MSKRKQHHPDVQAQGRVAPHSGHRADKGQVEVHEMCRQTGPMQIRACALACGYE